MKEGFFFIFMTTKIKQITVVSSSSLGRSVENSSDSTTAMDKKNKKTFSFTIALCPVL